MQTYKSASKVIMVLDLPDSCRQHLFDAFHCGFLYGVKTAAGAYIWLFLAGIGLIILGAERVMSGLCARGVKTSSRLINIGVGVGLIIYIGSGFFYPQFATKWLIIFLGFGLLVNGIIRIVRGIKKKDDLSSIATGILITSLSVLVLSYPKLGLALL
jgi:hypothetical protein